MLRWIVAACCVCLAGCQSRTIGEVFDAKEASFVLAKGTGRIDGQAFLRRDYGKLVTAAGERVFLIPATRYTIARFNAMFDGDLRSYFGNDVDAPPPDYYTYRRETKVDMRGRFVFEDLAAGRYIVATRVFWTEPTSYLTRGGAIYDIVEVKKDETVTVIVSGK
ncbi:carboxypeptidase regulatory-like domain-containing protein [Enterovirga rhinocerotis]|uniref:Uncharacterized protein n=1 Tax=Enterovirga rhinocerotis TaxID=1339210 RepID=A0A4R7BVH4_9HYPH|nr:carboxypeptidase regulatory-like domain-containing protein [Enterovirga rhinocerotis]TDR88006.1 hypothetical protein EV668_3871 [Enterovirga rhinocerotis]